MASTRDTRAALTRLAHAERLGLLVDLDGTLIPFAATPGDAALPEAAAQTLRTLHELGVQVVAISGRPCKDVDPLRGQVPAAWWFAEHGAWRHDTRAWTGPQLDGDPRARLRERLGHLAATVPGARVEPKTLSCAVHWRAVGERGRDAFIGAVELAIEEWLETHPDHERLDGVEMIEVRSRDCHKGRAVEWTRRQLPDARFLALGDDLTDEDMFRALGEDDVAIAVGRPAHPTRARAFVADVAGAHRLLAWLTEARGLSSEAPAPVDLLDRAHSLDRRTSLLVISNRTPLAPVEGRGKEVGGLVAALEPVLERRGGVWLGWSGADGPAVPVVTLDTAHLPARASFDFPPGWRTHFYGGLCNRALWPLLHGFPGRVRYDDEDWLAYLDANATYARFAAELVAPDATVWVHDYHLFLVGQALRRLGHTGPIGFFLHVPFPSRDLIDTLPWARELLSGLLAFDVVGLHTRRYVENALAAVRAVAGAKVTDDAVSYRGRTTRFVAAPIGIDPAPFRHDRAVEPNAEIAGLRATLGDRKLLLGVDRLDYSKGVPERLAAFERLLERYPEWRRRVSMVQISVPSRADVPEYAELRTVVEHLVGRINGRFGDADWVPVRYLYRSYDHAVLSQLYRAADVCVVTPLRDGMNLVAKEVVAAQDPRDPAALVLSRFAGAAESLTQAILTNPYHPDGVADDLARALAMTAEERRDRHAAMYTAVSGETSHAWADRFLEALREPGTRDQTWSA